MALAKVTTIDLIQVTEFGTIQVRRATHIEEDGVRIGNPAYHRAAYDPTDAPPPGEDARVQAIANVVWTPAVVAAYRARKAANNPNNPVQP